jgi:hypothetical protein
MGVRASPIGKYTAENASTYRFGCPAGQDTTGISTPVVAAAPATGQSASSRLQELICPFLRCWASRLWRMFHH